MRFNLSLDMKTSNGTRQAVRCKVERPVRPLTRVAERRKHSWGSRRSGPSTGAPKETRERRVASSAIHIRRTSTGRTKLERTPSTGDADGTHTTELQDGGKVRVGIMLTQEGDERDEIEFFSVNAIDGRRLV